MATPLSKSQFKGRKDPASENEKPSFGGGSGSKTMKIERPKGLKKGVKVHPHRDHAGSRSKRAIPNKKKK